MTLVLSKPTGVTMIPSLLLLTALDARVPAPQTPTRMWPGIVDVAWGAFGCFMHVEGTLTRPGGGEILYFVEEYNRETQVVTARLTPLGLETMADLTFTGAGFKPALVEDSSMTSGYFQLSYRREGELFQFSEDVSSPSFGAHTLGQFTVMVMDRMRRCEDSEMIELLSGCD